MNKVTGLCWIMVNGVKLHSEAGATLNPGGPIAKPAVSTSGFVGLFTDEIQAAKLKFKLMHTGDIDVVMLQQLRGVTLVFETDSGQRYLIRNAGTTDAIEFSKNSVDMTMEGAPAELM